MIPEDTQIQEDFMENRIHFTNVQKINKTEVKDLTIIIMI